MIPKLLAAFLLMYTVIVAFPIHKTSGVQLVVIAILMYLSYHGIAKWGVTHRGKVDG
jgi:uncharacterized membrane protein YphA (DoxX/SURF4 family)